MTSSGSSELFQKARDSPRGGSDSSPMDSPRDALPRKLKSQPRSPSRSLDDTDDDPSASADLGKPGGPSLSRSVSNSFGSKNMWRRKPPVTSSPKWMSLHRILLAHRKGFQAAHSIDASHRKHWIQSASADMTFGAAIALQAVVMGLDVELHLRGDLSHEAGMVFACLEALLSSVFIVELTLRGWALGWRFFCTLGGLFDTVVVAISVLDVARQVVAWIPAPTKAMALLRMLRLLRLLRIARLVQLFPEIRLLVEGLLSTFTACLWTIVMLSILAYIGALLCAVFLGSSQDEEIQDLFGSVPKSILTHIKLTLVEAWPDIAAPMVRQSGYWAYYLAALLCVTSIGLLNVVTGVVCEQVLEIAANAPADSADAVDARQQALKTMLQRICDSVSGAEDATAGFFSERGILKVLLVPEMLEEVKNFEVGLPLNLCELMDLLDADGALTEGHGALSTTEFCEGLLRMRGTGQGDLLGTGLQRDLRRSRRAHLDKVTDLGKSTRMHMRHVVEDAGWKLLKRFKATMSAFEQLEEQMEETKRLTTQSQRRKALQGNASGLLAAKSCLDAAIRLKAARDRACVNEKDGGRKASLPGMDVSSSLVKVLVGSSKPYIEERRDARYYAKGICPGPEAEKPRQETPLSQLPQEQDASVCRPTPRSVISGLSSSDTSTDMGSLPLPTPRQEGDDPAASTAAERKAAETASGSKSLAAPAGEGMDAGFELLDSLLDSSGAAGTGTNTASDAQEVQPSGDVLAEAAKKRSFLPDPAVGAPPPAAAEEAACADEGGERREDGALSAYSERGQTPAQDSEGFLTASQRTSPELARHTPPLVIVTTPAGEGQTAVDAAASNAQTQDGGQVSTAPPVEESADPAEPAPKRSRPEETAEAAATAVPDHKASEQMAAADVSPSAGAIMTASEAGPQEDALVEHSVPWMQTTLACQELEMYLKTLQQDAASALASCPVPKR
eukprot:TRINITY_DN1569_c2_g1_i1.p1 TRINITY_DN1569_c2_g1~~TRINITY_DN1569_c2_g1_i1.p1  ORF type:complete len:960 (-),score=198.18 TRINITY_DN1569_c2_g1_i1:1232-4111(-)